MSPEEEILSAYRAGLDAELLLLARLDALATRQVAIARRRDAGALSDVTEQRDRAMAALVAIEDDLRPLRAVIAADRPRFAGAAGFAEVAALHRDAAARVAAIVTNDEHSLAALRDAEAARRLTARAIEQGESTLAAYRRVAGPGPAGSSLVSRRG